MEIPDEKVTKIKRWAQVILLVALIALGFFAGRKTIKVPAPETIIKYVQLPPVHDTVDKPVPFKVTEPIDTLGFMKQVIRDGIYQELWPEKVITEYITKEDTTKIMEDWASQRFYTETLFDIDTLGRCVVNATVQYNRLNGLGYDFTPMSKVVTNTVYTVKKFSPFVGGGMTVSPWAPNVEVMPKVMAGLFIKEKFGFEVDYQRSFISKTDYIGGAILFKF